MASKRDLSYLRQVYLQKGVGELNKALRQKPYGEFDIREVAYILCITYERVRQIESSAIKKLKRPSLGIKLKKLLEADTIIEHSEIIGEAI